MLWDNVGRSRCIVAQNGLVNLEPHRFWRGAATGKIVLATSIML